MKKFICRVCGYIYEGEEAPEKCPQCGAPKDKFDEMKDGVKEYADEHKVGVAKGVPADGNYVPSGFKEYDKRTNGFARRTLTIILMKEFWKACVKTSLVNARSWYVPGYVPCSRS